MNTVCSGGTELRIGVPTQSASRFFDVSQDSAMRLRHSIFVDVIS